VTDAEIETLIDEKIRVHDQDPYAHALAELQLRLQLAESKTGMWSVVAADTFAGSGALGSTPVGNLPWSTNGLERVNDRIRHPTDGFAAAWLNAAMADGQIEANLYPGGNEASLYVRLNAALNQWLILQRSSTGSIRLFIQWAGTTIPLVPAVSRPVVDGERYKIRFLGADIWVFRMFDGEEEFLFSVSESRLSGETIHGIRLNGGGSVDDYKILKREAI